MIYIAGVSVGLAIDSGVLPLTIDIEKWLTDFKEMGSQASNAELCQFRYKFGYYHSEHQYQEATIDIAQICTPLESLKRIVASDL